MRLFAADDDMVEQLDADGLFDIADYSRMDECRIAAIIDYCTDLGLFDKRLWQEKQILTSNIRIIKIG